MSFGASPHGLEIEGAFNSIILDGGGATPAGSVSPWVSDTNGHAHGHLEFLLDEADATATPGVYLFSLSFDAQGLLPTDPVYFFAGFGLPEPEMDEALDAAEAWADANLVPEPTTLSLVALSGLYMARRR